MASAEARPSIEDFGPADAPSDGVASLAELLEAERAELRPEDPPKTPKALAAQVRAPEAKGWRQRWLLARENGEPVGYATTSSDRGRNPDIAWLQVYVLPGRRRRGIGRSLVHHALSETARLDPEPTVTGFEIGSHTSTGRALQARVEQDWRVPVRVTSRLARLDLAAVDRAACAAELEQRRSRLGEGHRLHFFQDTDILGPATGFRIEDYCATYEAIINLMPVEDLALQTILLPPERWRSQVARRQAMGATTWQLVCCDPSGHVLGLTVLSVPKADPVRIEQLDTGVLVEAQGQGIGTLLKLAMLQRVLDTLPEARFIDTDTVGSNAPMKAVNAGLGYRETRLDHGYQLPIQQLFALLGVEAP